MGNSTAKAKYDSSDASDCNTQYGDCEDSDSDSIIENIPPYEETTDAALRPTASLPRAQDILNVEKVREIEKQLDIEEIISLVYLLVEDSTEIELQLQMILLLMRGGNRDVLSLWAEYHSQRNNIWQNKVVEALCIIKNYKILHSLGYEQTSVVDHFLPNNVQSLHISKLKKAIYLICDNLDVEETITFLNHMRQNFRKRGIVFDEYGDEYLEVYFLKWESMRELNFSDIKLILKTMGQESLKNMLESVLPEVSPQLPTQNVSQTFSNYLERPSTSSENSFNSQALRNEHFIWQNINMVSPKRTRKPSSVTSVDNQPRANSPSENIARESSWQNLPLESITEGLLLENNFMDFQHDLKQIVRGDIANKPGSSMNILRDCYPVDPNRPGIVLIINQANFFTEIQEEYKHLLADSELKLDFRGGTEKDEKELEKIFKRFGFKVIIKHNLTHLDMLEAIRTAVNQVTDESSLFICIMSHGDTGVVYGSNSCRVRVSKIQEIMSRLNQKNLVGKPKILILQSCQGQKCQKLDNSDEDDEHVSLTTDGPNLILRDMLTFWATIPGYAAIRNKRTGSWFIQALCKMMKDYGNELHFSDICTKVNGEVQKQVWDKGKDGKNAMTPLLESTLGKPFYLPRLI